jgi:hypothetical protein
MAKESLDLVLSLLDDNNVWMMKSGKSVRVLGFCSGLALVFQLFEQLLDFWK